MAARMGHATHEAKLPFTQSTQKDAGLMALDVRKPAVRMTMGCSDYTFTRIWLGLGQSLFAERNFCNARLRPLPYPFQNCHHERWFSIGAVSAA